MNLRTIARWLNRLVACQGQEKALLAASVLHAAQHAIAYLPGDAGTLATQVLTADLLERSKEQKERVQRLSASFHERLSPLQTAVESEALWTVVLSLKAILHFQQGEVEQMQQSMYLTTVAYTSMLAALQDERGPAIAPPDTLLPAASQTVGGCAVQSAAALVIPAGDASVVASRAVT